MGTSNNRWRTLRLGDICREDRRIIDPTSHLVQVLPYISLEHIESETGRMLKDPLEAPSDSGKSTTFFFDDRHVLYGKLRPYLNKVALPDFGGRCTTELIPLLPLEGTHRVFLAWLLRRKETVDIAMQDKTGSRMPRTNMESLLRMEIDLPPYDDQRRIAATLREQMAAVEDARKAAEEQHAAAKILPAAVVREVFESERAQNWPSKRIGDIAETASGSTPSRARPDYYMGFIPWVKTSELRDGVIHDTEEHITEAALNEHSLRLLPVDTVLIAMYGQGQTRGRTALLSTPAATNQACFAVLPNKEVFVPQFLQFWFRYNYARLRRKTEARGGNQPNLSGVLLLNETVPIPELALQRKIVDSLNERLLQCRPIEESLGKQIDCVVRLRRTLLHRAFRRAR